MLSVVIPVAGRGTRALPASKAIPKEMFPVFDRPIIQWIVEEAVAAGAKDLTLVTGRGKSALEDHFDVDADLEGILANKPELLAKVKKVSRLIEVKTVRQKQALGLGHAVLMAKSSVVGDYFGVALGDEMIVEGTPGLKQLTDFHETRNLKERRAGAVLLMEVSEAEASRYGICEMDADGRISRCIEKPKAGVTKSRWALIGRYLLPADVFSLLERVKPGTIGEIQLTDGLQMLADEGRLYGCVLKGTRCDAGDRLGWIQANLHYYLKSEWGDELRRYLNEKV